MKSSIVFLYTSNEQIEFEIANTILFILAQQNMCKVYYGENYKTLMNEIKELNKWRDI